MSSSDGFLTDLLSEDDSIDSFFDLDKKKSSNQRSSVGALDKIGDVEKNKFEKLKQVSSAAAEEDWLGLKTNEVVKNNKNNATFHGPTSILKMEDPAKKKTIKKISFEDDEDILDTLGLEKEIDVLEHKQKVSDSNIKPIELSASKSSLMESILGSSSVEDKHSRTPFDNPAKESTAPKQDSGVHVSQQHLKGSTNQIHQNNLYAPSSTAVREGRRSRHQTPRMDILDPLGLLTTESSKKQDSAATSMENIPVAQISMPKSQSDIPTVSKRRGSGSLGIMTEVKTLYPPQRKDLKSQSSTNLNELPNWLAGESSSVMNKSKEKTNMAEPEPIKNRDNIEVKELEQDTVDHITDSAIDIPSLSLGNPSLESLIQQQKLTSSQFGYQNTAIALQQQESQLLVALQLKKYEQNLAEMQKKQQDILLNQEQQFNSLMERQFIKQQVMENNMMLQQERINNHIQLLISQPGLPGKVDFDKEDKISELQKNTLLENSNMYEKHISTLKERHHEELFLIEESYKKQISLLEQSNTTIENHLKTETVNLMERHQQFINLLKSEYEAEVEKYKHKLVEVSAMHANEIKLLRENHNRIIEDIKYEYTSMVENLKQIKETENTAIDKANVYSAKLDHNLELLDVNSKTLNAISGKIHQDHNILTVAREESFKIKEKEIQSMRSALENARESAEIERSQLMGLVRALELKLVEQNENAREERWALQQASATLAARSVAFDRECEFSRTSIERERDQLKTLKETLLAEQEKVILAITEEKLKVSAEKIRLETSAKLQQNYDSQKGQVEMDAAIQAAKEATMQTDEERKSLYRQQAEAETLRRNLNDKEQKLNFREAELQSVIKNIERKALDGEHALNEAKTLQTKYNERLKDIQRQLTSLAGRERKLNEEKIILSKERLALQSNIREIKRCSLCTTDNRCANEPELLNDVVEHDIPMPRQMVLDSDILRLHYEVNEDNFQESHNVDFDFLT